MNPGTRRSVALSLLFASSVACAGFSSPMEPEPVVLDRQYTFACGQWFPGDPPATRALVDLRTHGQTADGRPTPEAIGAITAAGGRIVYVYNVAIVRAAMDLHRAASLVHLGQGPASYVKTVTDASNVDVVVIVMLSHPLTEADLASVRALGGTIMFEYHTLPGYAARVSDRVVPAIRALPGVRNVEADGIGCLL